MKNKEIEELLNTFKELINAYSPDTEPFTIDYDYEIKYSALESLLSYIYQLENTIDDMTNISYKDYDSWLKNKDYVKDLESFANQINYDMHPTTTLAYRTSIKNAIQILVKRLKETYTEDTVNELKQENKQLQNNRDKAIEINKYIYDNLEQINCGELKCKINRVLDILKGDSDEKF